MFSHSIRIGRLFGIDVDLDYTWFIILVVVAGIYATRLIPEVLPNVPVSVRLVLGLVVALLLFLSVLIHEFAHSLVAKSLGLEISGITLFLFGGVSRIATEPKSASVELKVSVVGPLTSLALAALFAAAAVLVGPVSSAAGRLLGFLGGLNLMLAIFNLLPGFPLDGGRVLRAIVWSATGDFVRATRIAAYSGQAFGFLFISLGVLAFFATQDLGGLMLGLVGWYLIQMAQNSQQQVMLQRLLRGVTVDTLMAKELTVIPADISVDEAVTDYFLVHNYPAFPVKRGDTFVGVLSLADVRRIPREEWASVTAATAVPPVKSEHVVGPGEDAWEALARMSTEGVGRLLVMEADRLVGILGRSHIIRLIRTRAQLGA